MATIILNGDERDYLTYCEREDGTVEIVDVAVGSERRTGKGLELVRLLFKRVPGRRVWAITRTENEIAQQWYESMRFDCLGVLRRFYSDEKRADAVMFGRSSGGPI